MLVIYSCCRHLWCLESNVPLDFDDKKGLKITKKVAKKGQKWSQNDPKKVKKC